MDIPSPSTPADSYTWTRLCSQSVTPGTPIKAPHGHSVPALSPLAQPAALSSVGEEAYLVPQTVVQTPSRSSSNIGKKLVRHSATPSHASQIQRIFQDAKASLQLDAAIASISPGSIASKLRRTGAGNGRSLVTHPMENKATEWRYSSTPQALPEAAVDVSEPFPAESPSLPDRDPTRDRYIIGLAKEPISSGFTTPLAGNEAGELMEDDVALPLRPPSGSSASEKSMISPSPNSGVGAVQVSPHRMTCTELERPMTNMQVSHFNEHLHSILHNTPKAQRERIELAQNVRVPAPVAQGTVSLVERDDQEDMILSPAAIAAAESATLKPNPLAGCMQPSTNEQNVRPSFQEADDASCCGTPTTNLLRVPSPDMSPHRTLPPGSPPGSPRSSTLQPIQLPLAPRFVRVNSTGSPCPTSKPRYSQLMDPPQPWQARCSPPRHERIASPSPQPQTAPSYHELYPLNHLSSEQNYVAPPPTPKPGAAYNRSDPTLNSQQLSLVRPLPPCPSAPCFTARSHVASPHYSSTATAPTSQSIASAAPNSKMRHGYRTGTLAAFEMSTTPLEKIGLGTPGQDEGGRTDYSGVGWADQDATMSARWLSKAGTGVQRPFQANDSRSGLARWNASGAARYYANAQARALGSKGHQEVSFCSSPPRAMGDFQSLPRRKRMRRSLSGGEWQKRDEGILDPETSVDGWMADEGRFSIRAVSGAGSDFVKREMMITTTPTRDIVMSSRRDQPLHRDGEGDGDGEGKDEGEDLRELSPYVTPYRKGKGPKKFRAEERRPSYWDSDILPWGFGERRH